jgi:RNA polymerase-binding protein DksA
MTPSEIKAFRNQLVALRSRLDGDVSHLTGEALHNEGEGGGNLSHTPIHMADLGTDNFEQEFTLSLLENEEQSIKEISAALERIDQGTFGQCEECHKPIPKPRLNALPFARHCVECARKEQKSS